MSQGTLAHVMGTKMHSKLVVWPLLKAVTKARTLDILYCWYTSGLLGGYRLHLHSWTTP